MAKKINKKTSKPKKQKDGNTRLVAYNIRRALFMRCGGHCSFRGCGKSILEHPVTLKDGYYAEAAHIYGFSEDGPRAVKDLPKDFIQSAENLMILCYDCHQEIDTNPKDYPVSVLQEYKKFHEQKVASLMKSLNEDRTHLVVYTAPIQDKDPQSPSFHEMSKAISPAWAKSKEVVKQLSGGIGTDKESFYTTENDKLTKFVQQQVLPLFSHSTDPVSIFALAPMPLLISLGFQIKDSSNVNLHQRHRDTDDWVWKNEQSQVEFAFKEIRGCENPTSVGILINVSGANSEEVIPAYILNSSVIYELTHNIPRDRFSLRTKECLQKFVKTYSSMLSDIKNKYSNLESYNLFPVVPAPIAIACGRLIQQKEHPKINIYDKPNTTTQYELKLVINE